MRLAAAFAGLTMLGALSAPAAEAAPPGIHWKACADPDLGGLQCGALTVPLDPARPAGQQVSIAVSRAPHLGGKQGYQGVLLVNPGGPGGVGRGFSADVAAGRPASLRRAYDVIGF